MRFAVMNKKAYERGTGVQHSLDIYRDYEPHEDAAYTLELDGEFVARTESRLEAIEEAEDTIKYYGWSHISPLCFA